MKRVSVLTVSVLLCLSAVGCGGGTGNLSGEIKFKGTPISYGQVAFYSEGKPPVVLAEILDGRYQAKGVPVGAVKISVQSIAPATDVGPNPDGTPGAKPNVKGPHVPIPAKYNDAKSSNLTATVQGGDQPHNIDLAP